MAMSYTLLLCTLKALFIADHAISNYPLTVLILTVVSSHICMHKAKESQDYLHVTFGPGTYVRIASHTSSIGCNKGDCSWVLQNEERIKEASRSCKIA